VDVVPPGLAGFDVVGGVVPEVVVPGVRGPTGEPDVEVDVDVEVEVEVVTGVVPGDVEVLVEVLVEVEVLVDVIPPGAREEGVPPVVVPGELNPLGTTPVEVDVDTEVDNGAGAKMLVSLKVITTPALVLFAEARKSPMRPRTRVTLRPKKAP